MKLLNVSVTKICFGLPSLRTSTPGQKPVTPSGVSPHIKSTGYCAQLGGAKYATCVKCCARRVLPGRCSDFDEDQFECSDVGIACETGAEHDPTEPPAKRRRTDAGAALLALVPPPWRHVVDKVPSRRLDAIADFGSRERLRGIAVYPPQDQIFAALDACRLDDVRIVIVGQDPYHRPGQAHGLAFSCNDGSIPRSLDNIFKELLADPVSLMCGHTHCQGCTETWLARKHGPHAPRGTGLARA